MAAWATEQHLMGSAPNPCCAVGFTQSPESGPGAPRCRPGALVRARTRRPRTSATPLLVFPNQQRPELTDAADAAASGLSEQCRVVCGCGGASLGRPPFVARQPGSAPSA